MILKTLMMSGLTRKRVKKDLIVSNNGMKFFFIEIYGTDQVQHLLRHENFEEYEIKKETR